MQLLQKQPEPDKIELCQSRYPPEKLLSKKQKEAAL